MIKANELRIGNWVKFINKTIQVHGGTIDDCYRANQSEAPFQYEPIPLTPETLQKAGFELVEDLGDIKYYQNPGHVSGYGVGIDHDELLFYSFYQIFDGFDEHHNILIQDDASFQYVHQLQNLIFALTGAELEIKL